MLDTEIPFEIHITTDDVSSNRKQEFVDFCVTRAAKPLMIELSKGNFVNQPMFSKVVYATDVHTILSNATEISSALTNQNFCVKRLKIEISPEHADLFKNYATRFDKYYEWHCKINYTHVDKLLEVCEKHRSHLSINALVNQSNTRFITLREFGTKLEFEQRVLALTNDLQNGEWTILKEEFEYCIYDNNNLLDNGWLPQ
ncbi:MAG: hypothetical protein ACRCYO_09295 [Bacteroidia bacterium]